MPVGEKIEKDKCTEREFPASSHSCSVSATTLVAQGGAGVQSYRHSHRTESKYFTAESRNSCQHSSAFIIFLGTCAVSVQHSY